MACSRLTVGNLVKKLFEAIAALKIIDELLDWNARARKNQRAAHFLQVDFEEEAGLDAKDEDCAVVRRRIHEILESARSSVARSVNSTQVVANWLIGREIVEEEQLGTKRACYGEQLIERLSERLRTDYGSGYSVQSCLI